MQVNEKSEEAEENVSITNAALDLPGCPGRFWPVPVLGVLALQGYLFPLRYYEYFPNGRVSVEGYKRRHSQHIWLNEGKWTIYSNDKDDRKDSEGFFHNGVRIGIWTNHGSIKQIEERDQLGVKLRTEYENGLPKVVWDRDKEPPHFWSATTFDDDPVKNYEILKAIDLKVQRGDSHGGEDPWPRRWNSASRRAAVVRTGAGRGVGQGDRRGQTETINFREEQQASRETAGRDGRRCPILVR